MAVVLKKLFLKVYLSKTCYSCFIHLYNYVFVCFLFRAIFRTSLWRIWKYCVNIFWLDTKKDPATFSTFLLADFSFDDIFSWFSLHQPERIRVLIVEQSATFMILQLLVLRRKNKEPTRACWLVLNHHNDSEKKNPYAWSYIMIIPRSTIPLAGWLAVVKHQWRLNDAWCSR